MSGEEETNGFESYKRLIVESLERIDSNLYRVETRLQRLEVTIAVLKVHSALFGAIAGALLSGIVALIVKFA